MTQRFRLARRAALLLPLLALLALGTVALTPTAGAAPIFNRLPPTIRVSKVDDATLRVDGSGFTPGGWGAITEFVAVRHGDPRTSWPLFGYDFFSVTANPFPCTPRQCTPGGGTFVLYIRNIPCGLMLSIVAYDGAVIDGQSNEVYAQSCFP